MANVTTINDLSERCAGAPAIVANSNCIGLGAKNVSTMTASESHEMHIGPASERRTGPM